MKYVAFLRGINVGGKSMVKMEDLRTMFESLGYRDVKTLLNSGNVIFDAHVPDKGELQHSIEAALETTFGRKISVLIRGLADINALLVSDPFKGIDVTKDTKLYVTFLSGRHNSPLRAPFVSPEKDMKIVRITENEVCTVITLSTGKNTTDMMGFLEKEFGKNVTTRNWNTLQKVAL